ncbi:hypothetical protein CHS0354_039599 [Potamilus streckersoni]|uniref:Uncharacterized protein n=1 Tax=Potamilus streckersoni TaxID=2493646 RepID=A0AAE0RQT8_9BIVA|nr:hypothetical protein CHS0354_039599 [Potamilus streckersoni]
MADLSTIVTIFTSSMPVNMSVLEILKENKEIVSDEAFPESIIELIFGMVPFSIVMPPIGQLVCSWKAKIKLKNQVKREFDEKDANDIFKSEILAVYMI